MPLLMPGEEVSSNEPGRVFARHHHLAAYAAVVVKGSCAEHGDCGRFVAREGDVLVHAPFDGHADRIGHRGAVIINVPLRRPIASGFGRVADLDHLVRAFEGGAGRATEVLDEQLQAIHHEPADWPDALAAELALTAPIRLGRWAAERGLHPASVSRGFRLAYGMTPKRYRLEQMAARAARLVASGWKSLAGVAAECGFADQAHMTRTISQLFGLPPAALRQLGPMAAANQSI